MTIDDWRSGYAGSLGVFLNGHAITEPGPRGETIVDRDFLLLFNAHSEPVEFTLPADDLAPGWQIVVDTASSEAIAPASGRNGSAAFAISDAAVQPAGGTVLVADRAIIVLRAVEADPLS
jgi:glycogen operon protein